MSYSLEHATLIARQLERLATYNAHQLAGQFANLDFWLAEAAHALHVLDDYPRRFKLLHAAQEHWVKAHGTLISEHCPTCGGRCEFGPQKPNAPTRISTAQLEAARRSVKDATYHLLLRLYRAQWIDQERLKADCARVGTSVDLADLEHR